MGLLSRIVLLLHRVTRSSSGCCLSCNLGCVQLGDEVVAASCGCGSQCDGLVVLLLLRCVHGGCCSVCGGDCLTLGLLLRMSKWRRFSLDLNSSLVLFQVVIRQILFLFALFSFVIGGCQSQKYLIDWGIHFKHEGFEQFRFTQITLLTQLNILLALSRFAS